jgi:DICT domain-containing protein
VTGVAPDGDDDDAQAASAAPRPRRAPSGPPPERAPGNLPRNGDGSISRSQVTDAELRAAGVMDSAQQAEHTALRKGAEGRLPKAERGQVQHLDSADPDDPWLGQPATPLRAPRAAQNPAQVIVLHFTRLGFTADDREQRLAATAALAGRDSISSTSDLTAAEGAAVKAALQRCRDRAALDELLAAGGADGA